MPVVAALDFLADTFKTKIPPVCAVFGDEPFLKTAAIAELRQQVLGEGDAEFSLTRFSGRSVEAREVFDELATVALFGGGERLVIVEDADDFVSQHRAALEAYVAEPSGASTLALVVDSWPSNTRLAKAVAATGLAIECKFPAAAQVLKWLVTWARNRHRAKLERDAAELLLEIVGPEMGLLDQELAKLAAAAGQSAITAELVQQLVGGWRAKTAWDMLDAALEGRARQALVELDRLLLAGEVPIAILAQIGASLRRFAAATRYIQQAEAAGRKTSLRQALEAAGVKPAPFIMNKAEAQLRQLGRQRGGQLLAWLLEVDLALKGSSSSPPKARIVLEQLLVRLSTPTKPAGSPAPRPTLSRTGAGR
ncbi:MAG TPA: DNA polymerase III subunit delta [Pirellulales bacterium]|nr:DNA polymerase III subunit delta [Pirellulales bacterium]